MRLAMVCLLSSILIASACSGGGNDRESSEDSDALITEQLADDSTLRSASGITDQKGEILIEDSDTKQRLVVQVVDTNSRPVEGASIHFATDGDAFVVIVADPTEQLAPAIVSTRYPDVASIPLAVNLIPGSDVSIGQILQPAAVKVLKVVLEAVSAIGLGVDALELATDFPTLLSFTVLDSTWCIEPDQLANITGVYVGVVFLMIGGGIVVTASETVGSVLLERGIIATVKEAISVRIRHFSFAPVGLALPVEVEGPCEPDSSSELPQGSLCDTEGYDLRDGGFEQEADLDRDGVSERLSVQFSQADSLALFTVLTTDQTSNSVLAEGVVEAHDVGAVSGPMAVVWHGDLTGDGVDEAVLCVRYWGANDQFLSALVVTVVPQGGATIFHVDHVPNGDVTWSGSELVSEDLVNWLAPDGGVCLTRTKTFFTWDAETFVSVRNETVEEFPEGAGCAGQGSADTEETDIASMLNAYAEYINNEQWSAACELYAEEILMQVTCGQIQSSVERAFDVSGGGWVKIDNVTIDSLDGDTATATYESCLMSFAADFSVESDCSVETTTMLREGGGWKIGFIQSRSP